jgi:hypothetical protein
MHCQASLDLLADLDQHRFTAPHDLAEQRVAPSAGWLKRFMKK